jgi:hypothetical protein
VLRVRSRIVPQSLGAVMTDSVLGDADIFAISLFAERPFRLPCLRELNRLNRLCGTACQSPRSLSRFAGSAMTLSNALEVGVLASVSNELASVTNKQKFDCFVRQKSGVFSV